MIEINSQTYFVPKFIQECIFIFSNIHYPWLLHSSPFSEEGYRIDHLSITQVFCLTGCKNTKNPVGYVRHTHRLSSEVPPKYSSCQWASWQTKCKQAPGVKGKSLRFVLKGTCRPCSSKRKLEVLTSCPVRCHMSSAIANLMSSTVPVAATLQSTTSTTGTLVTITANHWALDSRFVPSSRFAASASLFILTVKQGDSLQC